MAVSRKLKKEEKCLLIGFATNILSESPRHHILDFMKSEITPAGRILITPLLFEKSSDLDSECDEVVSEDETSFEQSLLLCSDKEFHRMFRMKRSSMQALLERITLYLSENKIPQGICPNAALNQAVLATVWLLGNCQNMKRAAQLFGLTRIDTEVCFLHVCSVLSKLMAEFIRWPNAEEEERLVLSVESVHGFPGVVGMLGNSKLALPRSYGTLKMNVAVIQAVVDSNMFFRDVYVGPPGVDSAQTVFHASPLYAKLVSRKKPLIGPHKHIIGSKDYPQLATLITPYKGKDLSEEEIGFNKSLETAYGLVDKVFHALLCRFRRLQLMDVKEAEHIGVVVTASCVLHNFLLKIGDIFDDELDS